MYQIQAECVCGGKLFPCNVETEKSVTVKRRCRTCASHWEVNAVPLVPKPGETIRRWDVLWRCIGGATRSMKATVGEEITRTLMELR